MIKKTFWLMFFGSLYCSLNGITQNESDKTHEQKKEAMCDQQDTWITIFVHGSFSLKPHLNIKNILKMASDTIEDSVYYRSTEINRRDPFFYKNQAMAALGLHPINIYSPTIVQAAPTVAFSFEKISELAGYPKSDHYYTFGWSGLVSNKLRYIEAGFLYNDMIKLIKQLKDSGIRPKIRMLGYSHGGNLILQLGAIHQTKPDEEKIYVDEFHLIGTPIQLETDYLAKSSVFKKIYNWYSRADGVQSLDFFSYKRFFSKKKFMKRKNFTLPDNLTQIRIKISQFTPKKGKTLQRVPVNDQELYEFYKEKNFDPGHFELWFMGWTTLRYRKTFPINPLPVMIFLPIITQYINQHPEMPKDIVAFIQPDFNRIEIFPYRPNRRKQYDVFIPFVDKKIVDEMKEKAWKFTPDDYNLEIYNRKVYDAIKIVQDELTSIKKIMKKENKKNCKLQNNNQKKKTIIITDTYPTYEEHLKSGEVL